VVPFALVVLVATVLVEIVVQRNSMLWEEGKEE